MNSRRDAPRLALTLLTAILTVGFIDRIVMNVLAVPVQAEFHISDTQVGLLTGLAFAILNVTLGIAVARYAERGNRMRLIVVGTLHLIGKGSLVELLEKGGHKVTQH